jgi:hypothetical protein
MFDNMAVLTGSGAAVRVFRTDGTRIFPSVAAYYTGGQAAAAHRKRLREPGVPQTKPADV